MYGMRFPHYSYFKNYQILILPNFNSNFASKMKNQYNSILANIWILLWFIFLLSWTIESSPFIYNELPLYIYTASRLSKAISINFINRKIHNRMIFQTLSFLISLKIDVVPMNKLTAVTRSFLENWTLVMYLRNKAKKRIKGRVN